MQFNSIQFRLSKPQDDGSLFDQQLQGASGITFGNLNDSMYTWCNIISVHGDTEIHVHA